MLIRGKKKVHKAQVRARVADPVSRLCAQAVTLLGDGWTPRAGVGADAEQPEQEPCRTAAWCSRQGAGQLRCPQACGGHERAVSALG